MANDFLHKIDLNALSAETGLSLEEIAKLVGISDPKNLSKWKQEKPDGSRPKYNALIKLLKNGATVETLFGVDYSECKKVYPNIPPEFLESPEFMEGIRYQLAEGIKENGLVKEERVKYVVRQELEKLLPELKKADKI